VCVGVCVCVCVCDLHTGAQVWKHSRPETVRYVRVCVYTRELCKSLYLSQVYGVVCMVCKSLCV